MESNKEEENPNVVPCPLRTVRARRNTFNILPPLLEVLTDPNKKGFFGVFLANEYSVENLHFYVAVEDLKKQTDPSVKRNLSRLIYEKYIVIGSPMEVNLGFTLRKAIDTSIITHPESADIYQDVIHSFFLTFITFIYTQII
jgi:hypothetical protein